MTPQDWKRIQKGIFAGESGGDYNALFNYQNRPDGRFADIDLQNMTIDQALDFAKPSGKYGQYVKSQVGHVATPMGAYQIVGSTLRDAKRGLGLRGDELMTPEMQDRLGQWIYQKQGTGAWAGYKPQPSSQDIADQTMTALGRGPRGILAPTEPEAQPMIAEQQPKGLLASLGIQKMQPGAEGETGQRFYERDTFKDTAARMAQGFAALGGNPAMQRFAADVAAQRTEGKARNKTAEYLRRSGRADLAGMVEQGLISGRDAAGAIMQQPKDERTSLMKNYEFYIGKGMSPEEAMQAVKSGTSVTIGQKGADQFDKLDSTALSEVSQAGMTAARSLTQIDRLEALLSNVDTGVAASVKDLAGNFGINTEGLDDIQAAKALINNLVPQQRAPGRISAMPFSCTAQFFSHKSRCASDT